MRKIICVLILSTFLGCNSKIGGIKNGVFELYEKDSLVGKIYRLGNYQIEKYPNSSELIARIDYKTDSTYLLSGIEKNKKGIDSIIWLNNYTKISKNKFRIVATAINSNIDYKYEAVLLKIEEKINKEYLEKLNSLNLK